MKKHVVIVGGGITGLSAAYTLFRRTKQDQLNLTCTVLEKDNRLGGKIRTHRENGFVMEEGPDSILARKPAGVELIRELGIESEIVGSNPEGMKTYILHDGKLESIPPGTNMGIPMQLRPFATTKLVSVPGKARALLDLVLPKSTVGSDVALGPFLRRRLGDEVVNNIIEPLLAGIYAGSVDELSLNATFPQFLQLEQEYGSLIRGSLRQRQKTPTLTANHGRSVFITLRSGLQTIVERLHDELHTWADLHINTAVTAIRRTESGQYALTATHPKGTFTLTADAVVMTAQAPVAAQLLRPLCPQAETLRHIPYVSTAAVILGYHQESLNVSLEGSGFVIPRAEGRGITACTWTSSKWPHTAPPGQALLRCYVGRAGQQEPLQQSDEDMVAMVRAELEDIVGLTSKPWFTRVVRWNAAMPQYLVHHRERVDSVKEKLRTSVPGLFLAGAGYHAVGIPDCIADGQAAAGLALQHLGLGH